MEAGGAASELGAPLAGPALAGPAPAVPARSSRKPFSLRPDSAESDVRQAQTMRRCSGLKTCKGSSYVGT